MSKLIKRTLTALLVFALSLSMTACGNSGTTNNTSTANTPSNSSNVDAPPAEAKPSESSAPSDNGQAEYAVVLKVFSSQFWQTMKEGVEAEAARLGIKVDVYAANSEDDVEGQVNILENAISKGYKGIAVAPISADNLNNAIAEATAKGIYVVNIDEMVNLESLKSLGGAVYAYVATDNVSVGKMGAQHIIDQIGEGKVAIIEGKAGAVSGEDRRDGATAAFTDAAGIELVESQPADWDRTAAYDLATNYINKYPDLKGIYCCNDTMAMGALEAVKNSGLNIMVVGTDGNDDAVESVKAGELAATVAQDPAQVGARGLQLLIDAVESGSAINPDVAPITEGVNAILITKD